jgi:hypothetical protein
VRSWVDWHGAYEQPESSLARRLEVVRKRLRTALEQVGPSATILSLCSGDGRDVIGTLTDYPNPTGRVVLVEIDPKLASRAIEAAEAQKLTGVEVRCNDAGAVESFVDVLPVDVLLLCGIFGNIDHSAVKRVVESVPNLVRVGGYVIWTRGGSEPDQRLEIRNWFKEAGFEELAFDGAPEPYGVSLNRITAPRRSQPRLPETLFTFQ